MKVVVGFRKDTITPWCTKYNDAAIIHRYKYLVNEK